MNFQQLQLIKFGQVFSSRQEGREAALSAIAYHLDKASAAELSIDFEGVMIMTPSWLSEFIQTLKSYGFQKIVYKNKTNKSVSSSIDIVTEEFSSSGS